MTVRSASVLSFLDAAHGLGGGGTTAKARRKKQNCGWSPTWGPHLGVGHGWTRELPLAAERLPLEPQGPTFDGKSTAQERAEENCSELGLLFQTEGRRG